LVIDLLQSKLTAEKLGERGQNGRHPPEEEYVVMLLTGGGRQAPLFLPLWPRIYRENSPESVPSIITAV
jgi:hypothetical protein